MNNQQKTKFEFLLTLDNNIVCQRFFKVEDHNPLARTSLNLHEYVKNICNKISDELKIKSSNYLCENQNFLFHSENVEDEQDKKNEFFLLEIKVNDDVFIQRIFPAHYYHPKVRYTVDIRPRINTILSDLTEILSLPSEELETKYLQYELK